MSIWHNAPSASQRFLIVDFPAALGFLVAVFVVFPATFALADVFVVFVFAAAFGLGTLITPFAASRFISCTWVPSPFRELQYPQRSCQFRGTSFPPLFRDLIWSSVRFLRANFSRHPLQSPRCFL